MSLICHGSGMMRVTSSLNTEVRYTGRKLHTQKIATRNHLCSIIMEGVCLTVSTFVNVLSEVNKSLLCCVISQALTPNSGYKSAQSCLDWARWTERVVGSRSRKGYSLSSKCRHCLKMEFLLVWLKLKLLITHNLSHENVLVLFRNLVILSKCSYIIAHKVEILAHGAKALCI